MSNGAGAAASGWGDPVILDTIIVSGWARQSTHTHTHTHARAHTHTHVCRRKDRQIWWLAQMVNNIIVAIALLTYFKFILYLFIRLFSELARHAEDEPVRSPPRSQGALCMRAQIRDPGVGLPSENGKHF